MMTIKICFDPRAFRSCKISLILGWFFILFSTQGFAQVVTRSIPLDNGEKVNVKSVATAVTLGELALLVRRADRSTVKTDTNLAANGTMSADDQIAITDNMLVWFDTTNEEKFFSGGGGMLRGVWLLKRDSKNKLDFKYKDSKNWTPNALFPGQAAAKGNGRGDAWQILVALEASGFDVFRASATVKTTVIDDGTFDESQGVLTYGFTGTLRSGTGTSKFPYSDNFGTPTAPARLNYAARYRIHQDRRGDNGCRIDCSFTVRVASDEGLHDAAPVESVVFSFGMSRVDMLESMRLQNLQPVNRDWIRGPWKRDADGQLVNQGRDKTLAGANRFVPNPTGKKPEAKYIIGNIFRNPKDAIDVKYPAAVGNQFSQSLRLRVVSSVNSAGGVNCFTAGSYMQYIHDLPQNGFVHDVKIGDFAQGGPIGAMPKGSSISSIHKLFFDYKNP
jgi:hypothetical protein